MKNKKTEDHTKTDNAPMSGIFMLTSACNLRCDYCFEYEHASRHMSKETAQQGIRWLMSNPENLISIILFAGLKDYLSSLCQKKGTCR
jgi:sulfatase maturation enzyme AslB (radical SAM superfamily)